MDKVVHGCATTTEAVRQAMQNGQESRRQQAKRYGINQKTAAKWEKRKAVADLPTGPGDARSTVFSPNEKPLSLPSAGIRYCHLMTVFMPCSSQFLI